MINDKGDAKDKVMLFKSPKVMANIQANCYIVKGKHEKSDISALFGQMGADPKAAKSDEFDDVDFETAADAGPPPLEAVEGDEPPALEEVADEPPALEEVKEEEPKADA
eukprot:CAMPEP_0168509400 /NCGR_PEP_ID=MMETSP0405-20121227/748_1 /TAXON_ID=498012 /ORGANISM="Trichosphaerium sp, Strain Am-I-7 wt" /LENGTH=108 /DNA_ID=CAMNT_0008526841 /DNA_START=198 /DNA_END=524 /DNA_ORIENTATION=+